MLVLTEAELSTLAESRFAGFVRRAAAHLRIVLPDETKSLSDDLLDTFVRQAVDRAADYGVVSERDVYLFCELRLIFGLRFPAEPKTPWAEPILGERGVLPETRCQLLFAAANWQMSNSSMVAPAEVRFSAVRSANQATVRRFTELQGRRLSLGLLDCAYCEFWLDAFEAALVGASPTAEPPAQNGPRLPQPAPASEQPVRSAVAVPAPASTTALDQAYVAPLIDAVADDENAVYFIDQWLLGTMPNPVDGTSGSRSVWETVKTREAQDEDDALDSVDERIATSATEAIEAAGVPHVDAVEVIRRPRPRNTAATLITFRDGRELVVDWYAALDLQDPIILPRQAWLEIGSH